MLYIIKLPDNTLFVVDGGQSDQVSTTSVTGIYEFMKKITGTPDNEKIPITAWFFTHAHGDHNTLAAEFLGYGVGTLKTEATYGDKVDVRSVIFN
jgi:glyoxylase-like metal-dependent hydrolase (beta-lactamase superfamily II)